MGVSHYRERGLQVNVVLAVTYSGIEERLTKIVLKRARDKHGGLAVINTATGIVAVPLPDRPQSPRGSRSVPGAIPYDSRVAQTQADHGRPRGPKSKSDLAGSAQKVFTVRRRFSQLGSRGSLSRKAGAEVNHQAGSAPQKLAVLAGSVEDS